MPIIQPPLLTVVVTAYNYAHFLPECLDSILGQDFTDFELIVMDNCSTDTTPEVIAEYAADPRVQYIRHEKNVGSGINFNMAVRQGGGRYFAMISADDYILPGHFSKLIKLLQANPHCALAYTGIYQVDGDSKVIGEPNHSGYRRESYIGGRDEVIDLMLNGTYVCLPATVFDRQRTGPDLIFDLDAWGASDWDLAVRLAAKHADFIYDKDATVCYRRHAGQYTNTDFYYSPDPLYGHLFMLEQYLPRMQAEVIARHGAGFAGLLRRWSMSFGMDKLGPKDLARLQKLLAQLEAGKYLPHETMMPGRVSVLVRYDDAAAIDDILASIDVQTYRDWECIILYPEMTRRLECLMARIGNADGARRMVFVRESSRNPAEILNAGVAVSRGEYLLALNVQDPLPVACFDEAVALFEASPEVDILNIHSLGYRDAATPDPMTLLDGNPIDGDAFYRRAVFDLAGGYNPAFEEDGVFWNFWVHAFKRGARVQSAPLRNPPLLAAPPSDVLRAMLAFANPLAAEPDALKSAALYLIEQQHTWRQRNKKILAQHPVCSAANFAEVTAAAHDTREVAKPRKLPAIEGDSYTRWVLNRRLSEEQIAACRLSAMRWEKRSTILAVVLDIENKPAHLQRTLNSFRAQIYAPQNILVISPGLPSTETGAGDLLWLSSAPGWQDVLNQASLQTDADWFYLAHAGDSLEPMTFWLIADTANRHAGLAYIYTDEDRMTDDGAVSAPVCKPSINLDLLRSMPYVGRAAAIEREAFIALGGFAVEYGEVAHIDFLFKVIETSNFGGIAHLDNVLHHGVLSFADWCARADVGPQMAALTNAHLARLGMYTQILPLAPGAQRVVYAQGMQDMVSIIVQAGDSLAMLRRCVETVLSKTIYPNFEILVVGAHPRSLDAAGIDAWLAKLAQTSPNVRVLPLEAGQGVPGNYNQAAQHAVGDYLLFLGDRTAALHDNWLEVMLGHAQRQEVGIVGAKLINAQRQISHAGLVLGLRGPANSPFVGENFDQEGYAGRLLIDQNYSAVSGDCMLIRKSIFQAVGGFDQAQFRNVCGDIDLCLKVRQTGLLIVWTPHAVLMRDDNTILTAASSLRRREETETFYKKWWSEIGCDAAYNRNLALGGDGFELERREFLSSLVLPSAMPKVLIVARSGDKRTLRRLSHLTAILRARQVIDAQMSDAYLPLSELARAAPDAIVFHGVPDAAMIACIDEVKRATSIYTVFMPPPSLNPEVTVEIRQALTRSDRVLAPDAAWVDALSGLHPQVERWNDYLPTPSWEISEIGIRPVGKIRIGVRVDGATEEIALLHAIFAELQNEVEWFVIAPRYPTLLRPWIAQYHQQMFTDDSDIARLRTLALDLALVPRDGPGSRLAVLEYGICGVPVICSGAVAFDPSLPVLAVNDQAGNWIDAIRQAIAHAETLAAQGDRLQHAVRADYLLEGDHLLACARMWLPPAE